MLTPPDLSADTIVAVLRENYGLRIRQVAFLPIGADVNTAVYRLETDDGAADFLKVRRADFDAVAVEVPAALRAQGIHEVMAPLPTVDGQLWTSAHGFEWILYPFFAGRDGYEAPLSDAQWVALGRSLRAVHSAILPPSLTERVPRERYSPQWRDIVRDFDAQVDTRVYADPVARGLAEFWATQHDAIRAMVERAEELGRVLRERDGEFVLCHSDLHPGNVLLGANGELAIVDWDNPILAPEERDLILLGGGVSSNWNDPRQDALFFAGYGPTALDPVALSYYHYERIIADLAAFGDQIFGVEGSTEDREWGLGVVKGNFLPGQAVEIANRRYQQMPC